MQQEEALNLLKRGKNIFLTGAAGSGKTYLLNKYITRYKKEPQGATKATKLYARNINVDAINECELANIHGPEKTDTMTANGFSETAQNASSARTAR